MAQTHDAEKQEVLHKEDRTATFADTKSLGETATRTSYAATEAGGCVPFASPALVSS